MKLATILVAILPLVASCDRGATARGADEQASSVNVTTSKDFAKKHTDFRAYWHRGLAELNRYELKQSRYGELHDGEAVMVFVTEPFLSDKQVKQDFGNDPSAVQVLKNNFYRRFYTGVYPYTIMTSTFTPTAPGPTIKVTQSVQEWCGHVYAQLNLNAERNGYDVKSFSYFQSEADQELALAGTLVEDDLYTRIRLGPESLPTGELELLPSATYLRLTHKEWALRPATVTLSAAAKSDVSDEPVRTYAIA